MYQDQGYELHIHKTSCISIRLIFRPSLVLFNILLWRVILKYFLGSLSLPLIQEGQLSVSGKTKCTSIV